jgi:tetratricopeptide (TPR) repeat protein
MVLALAVGVPTALGDRAEAVAHYEKGIELAERLYRYRDAIAAFESAYRADPTLVEALISLGDAYGALGELEDARRYYETARPLVTAPALVEKVAATLGEIAYLQGDFAEAETLLTQARAIAPGNARVAGCLADTFSKRGRLDDAAQEYHRELAINTKSVHAHRGLAAVFAAKGDSEGTIRHAEAAIALDPFDSATFYLLAQALARQRRTEDSRRALEAYRSTKQYEEEVDALEKTINKTPDDLRPIVALAERHAAQGNLERAVDTYHRLMLLGVEPSVALVNIGLLRLRQGRFGEAKGTFEEAIRLSPKAATPYVGLAELAVAQERWEEARAAYVTALERDPTLEQAHAGLIQTLQRLGDRNGAANALAAWVQTNPSSSTAWMQWGLYHVALGRRDDAVAYLEKAVELDAENLDAANDLAWLYADSNAKLDRALELANRVISKQPSGNAFDTLSFVHRRRGDLPMAIRAMKRAVELEPDNEAYRARLAELEQEAAP